MQWDKITDRLQLFGEKTGKGLKNVFGARNERVVRTLAPMIKEINELEPWAQALTVEDFKRQTDEWKNALDAGTVTLDEILPKCFAMTREASVRTMGMRHFDVQLVGGIVLHQGAIGEMRTGEGKTLVATLPLVLNAMTGKPCFLVTVNDYLAKRDGEWMRPVYEYMGLTIGSIQSDMSPQDRHPAYACDIVYGTNNEFGFDYLRDNMKVRITDQVQNELYYAIVDEVDSILIDEARTPLIISGPAEMGTDKYKLANQIALTLVADEHYEVKEKERSATLLEEGIIEAEKLVGVESFYTPGNEDWPHYIENALRAHNLYTKDKEYVVEPGDDGKPEVIIVDEFTGRKMAGRRWSDGLHQAVESKENLEPKKENQTLATITFQNYFRLFDKLAGMTGTAITEAGEFHKIYGLEVVSIPTNLPIDREDGNDIVFRTADEKWRAIVKEIERVQDAGQPVLVGTTSVEKSEHLSGLLTTHGIKHEVLNAKNHEREAEIVARAGEKGSITVSTNMAGRGTDIKLGGNFEWRLNRALEAAGLEHGELEHLDEIARVREEVKGRCDADEQVVLGCGGLYVLGTERHEARRIDNQLRGRSGRQGNIGENRFYLSLQDDLMRIFYRDWVSNVMKRLGMEEDVPIESGMVTRAIERAQKKVEDRNFEIRKNLLEYDEVMDQQRKTIYGVRTEVLNSEGTKEKVENMLAGSVQRGVGNFVKDAEGFSGWFKRMFGIDLTSDEAENAAAEGGDLQPALDRLSARYTEREEKVGDETMRRIEQYLLLNAIDSRWKDHLHAVDSLKAGIGLRGYGQVDPKNEYKREGFELFQKLFQAIEDEVASLVLRIRVASEADEEGEGGEGQAAQPNLTPKGMVQQQQQMTPEQMQRMRQVQAARQASLQRSQKRAVPASHAFDKHRQTQVAQMRAQAQAKPAEEAKPQQRPLPEAVMKSTNRNDVCPCGSGMKFKKCHGRNA